MTFNAKKFAEQGGSLSKKLALVFNSIGASHDGLGDSAAYGKIIGIGGYGDYKVVAALSDNIAMPIFLNSTIEATSDDTSFIGIMCAIKNTLIDQPHKHMQCGLFSTSLNYDCFDAYAVQGHTTVATEMKTQNTNAHITGLSGKVVLTASPTKGWVTALLGIVEGVGVPSEMCHVCSLVVEATCTASAVQSLLHLYADKEIKSAIWMSGVANMLHLIHTDAATGCVVHGAAQPAGHAAAGYFLIEVNGTDYGIPYWTIADMANE